MFSWCSYKISSNVGRLQRSLMPERLFLIPFFSPLFIPTSSGTHKPYKWNLAISTSPQSWNQHSDITLGTWDLNPTWALSPFLGINSKASSFDGTQHVLHLNFLRKIIGWLLFSQITGNWNFWGWQSKFPASYFEEENPLLLQDLADNLMSLYHSQDLAQKVFMSLPELSFSHPLCPSGVACCPALNLLCSILKDKVFNFLWEFSWTLHWYKTVRYSTTCNLPEH